MVDKRGEKNADDWERKKIIKELRDEPDVDDRADTNANRGNIKEAYLKFKTKIKLTKQQYPLYAKIISQESVEYKAR